MRRRSMPRRTPASVRRTLAAVGLLMTAFPLVAQTPPPPPVRTPFGDVPANDPRREIIQTVLDSPACTTGLMTAAMWRAGDFHMAWQRVGQFFTQRVSFTTARDQFLTHFFNPLGYQELEIFDSDYLRMCVGNRLTFTREGVVGAYRGMRENDPAGAESFSRKLGALEPYFSDEASKERLRDMIGGELFDHLLDSLRREGYHMFAGALIHEGMHALMDDPARVAAIQEQYKSCKLPVQWDELRAYMAEINYHARFYNWAVGDIFASWKQIENLLKQLEALRKKPKPLSEADKEKLEQIKAKIKAYIALIRLRMREIEASAQRMQGLMGSFRQEHIKPTAPAREQNMIKSIAAAVTNFVTAVGQELQRQELLLNGLEEYLALWNRWAGCELKTPPEKKIADEILKRAKGAKWPAPPIAQADDIRKKAEKEIVKLGDLIGGAPSGPAGRGAGRNFTLSAFYLGTSPSLGALNDYIGYLNVTWDGDVPVFGKEHGFGVGLGWRFSPVLEAGLAFERTSAAVAGRMGVNSYVSTHSVNTFGIYLAARSPEVLPAVRLAAQAGAYYAAASYTETENDFVTAGRDGAFGWRVAAGPEVELAENMSLSLLGGYRQATLDGFEVSFFMPANPPVRLEFSGPTIQAGLSFRF
jgi:opacity protein-like surface antigen